MGELFHRELGAYLYLPVVHFTVIPNIRILLRRLVQISDFHPRISFLPPPSSIVRTHEKI